jgi:hypothetical protein
MPEGAVRAGDTLLWQRYAEFLEDGVSAPIAARGVA